MAPDPEYGSDVFVARGDLRFEWAPVRKGRPAYSSAQDELEQAIGAVIYEYSRLSAGFEAERAGLAKPSSGENAGFEDLVPQWQSLRGVLFSDSKRKTVDWDQWIWRRYRHEFGAPRMRELYGEAAASKGLQIGARLVADGRGLVSSRQSKFADTTRASELLKDLASLISLLHRASRTHTHGRNALTLDHRGYPVNPSASAIAELKGGRAGIRHDERPDMVRLTELAFRYRFDPTFLFSNLSFLGAHFAAAMAAGVAERRGEYVPDADAHYGLLGLINEDGDRNLDAEAVDARNCLRAVVPPELFAAATRQEPPPAVSDDSYRKYRDFAQRKGRTAKFLPKREAKSPPA